MAFTTGVQALQEAIEESQRRADAARSGSSGQMLNYWNWKPGDRKVVRFLADDLITEDFLDFILDNTGQTKNFMVDPADPDRLRRYMSPTPGIGWRRHPKTGELEDPKPRKMSVCVAVLRQEVPGPDNKMVIEDYLYDRTVNGQTYPSRWFGIVQQSLSNFWHTLAVSCYKRYGTICDRDYEITRTGDGFNTTYDIIPLPEVPELTDPEAVKQFYFYGQEWSPEDPERFLKCPMTTAQWASYFSGEERYRHWLSPLPGTAPAAGSPATSAPSGLDEFRRETTHNDEAQAAVMPASGTKFASLSETLLKAQKGK